VPAGSAVLNTAGATMPAFVAFFSTTCLFT
jgi:hypothetical protein